MRVLVLWADRQSANLGVRVLAEGTHAILRQALGSDVQVQFQDFRGRETGVRISPRSLIAAHLLPWSPLRKFLSTFDLIVDTGAGDSFTHIYGVKRLGALVGVQALAVRLGIPLVLGPQTIGPFGRLSRLVAKFSLRGADLVVARDPLSYELACSLAPGKSILASDVVFALPQPKLDKDIRTTDASWLINVSGLLWSANSHVDHQVYRAEVADLVALMLAKRLKPVIFPHVLGTDDPDSDIDASYELAALFNEDDLEVFVPSDLADARSAIASSAGVVASRMHAALNAASTGTPAIAWAYSRKFEPLLSPVEGVSVIDLRNSSMQEVLEATLASVLEVESEMYGNQPKSSQHEDRLGAFRRALDNYRGGK